MNITLQINDENFNSFFGNVEDCITDEMKKDVLKTALDNWANADNTTDSIKKLMIAEGSYYNKYQPKLSDDARLILKDSILSDPEYVESIRNLLLEIFEKNGKEILIKSLAEILLSSIANQNAFIQAMQYTASDVIQNTLYDHMKQYHNNNNNY